MEMTVYNTDKKSRTWAEIDFAALKNNYEAAKRLSGNRPVMCVIKANAYGHGAVACGKYLEKIGAPAFAVACIDEAIELREGGITKPILILGYTDAQYVKMLYDNNITQTIVDYSHAIELNDSAKRCGVTLKTHVKVDTGMGRVGVLAQGDDLIKGAVDRVCEIIDMGNLDVVGMFTHFSVADVPEQKEYTQWQLSNFTAICNELKARDRHIECCHCSNSARIMANTEFNFDMVRAGIMLYGLYPDNVHRENGVLKPVMTLKSRVCLVKEYPTGSSISYGRMFSTTDKLTTAVLPVGYADGFSMRMSNSGYFTVDGEMYKQVGRVCMDMCMINITETPDKVKRGSVATIFGKGGMSAEQVAGIIGNINYEVTCLITKRVPRVYIDCE